MTDLTDDFKSGPSGSDWEKIETGECVDISSLKSPEFDFSILLELGVKVGDKVTIRW